MNFFGRGLSNKIENKTGDKESGKKVYSGGFYIGVEGQEGGDLIDRNSKNRPNIEKEKTELDTILEKVKFPNVDLSEIFKYYQDKTSTEQFSNNDKIQIEKHLNNLIYTISDQKLVYTTDLYYLFIAIEYIKNNFPNLDIISLYNDLKTYTSICCALCSNVMVQQAKWDLATKIYKRINKDCKEVSNDVVFNSYCALTIANLEARSPFLANLKFILNPSEPPAMLPMLNNYDEFFEGMSKKHFTSLLKIVRNFKNSEKRFEDMKKDEYLEFIKLNLREVVKSKNGFNPQNSKDVKLLDVKDSLYQELNIALGSFIRQMIDPNKTSEQVKKANPPQIFNPAQLFYFIEYFPEYAKMNWKEEQKDLNSTT